MEVDWDLHAVVRACCSTATTTTTSTTTTGAPPYMVDTFNQQKNTFQDEKFVGFFPDPFFQTRNTDNSIEQFLYDLNNNNNKNSNPVIEFHQKLHKPPQSPTNIPISPLSVLGGLQDPPLKHQQEKHNNFQQQHQHQKQQQQQQQKQVQENKIQPFGISTCTSSNAQSTRAKKRYRNIFFF